MLRSTERWRGAPLIVATGASLSGSALFCGLLYVHPGLTPGPYALEDVDSGKRLTVQLPETLSRLVKPKQLIDATLEVIDG